MKMQQQYIYNRLATYLLSLMVIIKFIDRMFLCIMEYHARFPAILLSEANTF